MMLYLTLFLEFFKTGLFAMGGGLATLPFLYEMADKYPWFTASQLADMIAISESTPGPIGINMATYAGISAGGIPGGIIATVGLITPSIIIILMIAKALQKFRDSVLVQQAFYGLRPAATGLIAAAGFQIVKICIFTEGTHVISLGSNFVLNLKNLLLTAILAFCVFKIKKHPIWFIVAGAVIGIVFSL